MTSQTQNDAPKILTFHEWTVMSYHTSAGDSVDANADEGGIDEALERDVSRYQAYLTEKGDQRKLHEFQALCTRVRCAPYQFVPPPQSNSSAAPAIFTREAVESGDLDITFSRYQELILRLSSQTWTASMAHREAHTEADRRELYGLTRNFDTFDGIDQQNPRATRLILEMLILEAEKTGSEVVRVEVLNLCRPRRHVLRRAVAMEMRLTEAELEGDTTALNEGIRIVEEYRLDNEPQVPDERDPPLESWEWNLLRSQAEREWQEEHDAHLTPEEWLEEFRIRLARVIEQEEMSDDELDNDNTRIRTFSHGVACTCSACSNFMARYGNRGGVSDADSEDDFGYFERGLDRLLHSDDSNDPEDSEDYDDFGSSHYNEFFSSNGVGHILGGVID